MKSIIPNVFSAPFWEYTNRTYEHSYQLDETDEGCSLYVNLPGIKKEDISLIYSSTNRTITLVVNSDGDPIINQNIYLQMQIDSDKIEATLELGVLNLTAPSLGQDTDKIIEIT